MPFKHQANLPEYKTKDLYQIITLILHFFIFEYNKSHDPLQTFLLFDLNLLEMLEFRQLVHSNH